MKYGFQAATATFCLCIAAAGAQAQSSVTLYGRAVAGADYQNNIANPDGKGRGHLWRHAGNQWGTSLLGVKGSEDLGGGMRAFFVLEGGFDLPAAKPNGADLLVNRRSYVGLEDYWGKLVLGKNLSIANDVWYLDPTGQQFIGTATLVRGRSWQGNDNGIEYTTPNWGGFSATVQTGLGEQLDGFTKLRKDGISLSYTAPSFEVRAIYDVARDKNGKYTELFNTSKELTLGGTATLFEDLKMFVGYQRLSAPDAPLNAPSKANHYWVGANYKLTPWLTLIGSMFRVEQNRNAGSANLYMLGANYVLSKRTLLYASVGKVYNSANANFSVEATNNNPPMGGKQSGTYFGISHTF
ncbi:porin [Variovorax sp. 38R]|uniref:porin n=1 Tax=Variovorax sp. 38R TaxID=2774875 RepID=UPI0017864C17|nr:porin [Variovorax sp. 38R]QOF79884.1 porin [Variovorax sp. 38R]